VTVQVHSNYTCCGKRISEMDFFNQTGATLFGITQQSTTLSYVDPNYMLQDGDILYFSGEKENTDKIIEYIKIT
jgi:K+/H+ antiporter YhaU regulatory subunit KhtT